MKIKCECCGYYTVSEEYDICPVCFWEYDPNMQPDCAGGANSITLIEAKQNYKRFGACEERFADNVRPPAEDELSPDDESDVYDE